MSGSDIIEVSLASCVLGRLEQPRQEGQAMNLSRRRVQRLGMEAVVACSARGLDLQCWRRPVFVLLPACQRCDGSADIDDTFGGVRSAGDERVNERARLGQCSGPDGGMDGVCDQRRCSRGQCCICLLYTSDAADE